MNICKESKQLSLNVIRKILPNVVKICKNVEKIGGNYLYRTETILKSINLANAFILSSISMISKGLLGES